MHSANNDSMAFSLFVMSFFKVDRIERSVIS